ncbi:MAG TPA: maleylpyruvate isomerase family mycothiol-dependent enzyme [Nocardioidaceae bacterium]|nr:maleylpyruvate isomerase family mycothiol-dependent enzyme [Nocardioidaceae bacterium]
MDYVAHFRREVAAFETAAWIAAAGDEAPIVPSCPEWSMTDLVAHLGGVHRGIVHIVRGQLRDEPDWTDPRMLDLPTGEDWPMSLEDTPTRGPVPAGLVDWFAEGAAALAELFAERDPADPVWTWSPDQSVGFWRRMQTIEAAVHRWDAENAVGSASTFETDLAADAVRQTFEVMAPYRRAMLGAPPGRGERYGFRLADGTGAWTVHFEGDAVRLDDTASAPTVVEFVGTATDLMLFVWGRLPADRLTDVRGDPRAVDRYFALVPRL